MTLVRPTQAQAAFTLIELMVAIAIVAMILTIGIPFVRTAIDSPRGINGAVRMVEDAVRDTRAKAILERADADLVIRRGEGSFSIAGASSPRQMESPDVYGNEWRMAERSSGSSAAKTEFRRIYPAKLPAGVWVEGLFINGLDWTEDEEARVRFYPDGTSDAMSLFLESDQSEFRNIWLEVVTGLPEVETDRHRFRGR
jgi:prepilin-type N-terminal cleavage/methylation domain-containing protein